MEWLAADYHFPSTYSIREPGSSMTNAKAMPAPGPATVRLALIRTSFEFFEPEFIEKQLFPVIRSAEIMVTPPDRIAIDTHTFRSYKPVSNKRREADLQEGLSIREVANAQGNMTVFMKIPGKYNTAFHILFNNIPYWGQANSFTTCTGVSIKEPDVNLVGVPLNKANKYKKSSYSCFVTEFSDTSVKFSRILYDENFLNLSLFIWPLEICEQHRGTLTLQRRSHS